MKDVDQILSGLDEILRLLLHEFMTLLRLFIFCDSIRIDLAKILKLSIELLHLVLQSRLRQAQHAKCGLLCCQPVFLPQSFLTLSPTELDLCHGKLELMQLLLQPVQSGCSRTGRFIIVLALYQTRHLILVELLLLAGASIVCRLQLPALFLQLLQPLASGPQPLLQLLLLLNAFCYCLLRARKLTLTKQQPFMTAQCLLLQNDLFQRAVLYEFRQVLCILLHIVQLILGSSQFFLQLCLRSLHSLQCMRSLYTLFLCCRKGALLCLGLLLQFFEPGLPFLDICLQLILRHAQLCLMNQQLLQGFLRLMQLCGTALLLILQGCRPIPQLRQVMLKSGQLLLQLTDFAAAAQKAGFLMGPASTGKRPARIQQLSLQSDNTASIALLFCQREPVLQRVRNQRAS